MAGDRGGDVHFEDISPDAMAADRRKRAEEMIAIRSGAMRVINAPEGEPDAPEDEDAEVKRAPAREGPSEPVEDVPAEDDGEDDGAEADEGSEAVEEEPRGAERAPVQDDLVEVEINGERRRVSRDDLVKAYKASADVERLRQETEIQLQQARIAAEHLDRLRREVPEYGPQQDQASAGQDDELAYYAEVAEALQYQDKAEAGAKLAQAIQREVKRRMGNGVDQQQITAHAAEQAMWEMRDEMMWNDANQRFAASFPEFQTDDNLTRLASTDALALMRGQLAQLEGRLQGMPSVQGMGDADAVRMYRRLALMNYVPPVSDVFTAAGERTRQWVQSRQESQPQGTASFAAKRQAKRALQQEPTAVVARASAQAEDEALTAEQKIEQMRAVRKGSG